jgi:acetoin:2,6-dichlorophenolindophenol oxidoreductase subunit alpha
VLAVRSAVAQAVERARAGEGPTLIEAVTYRHLAHNEGEEAFSGIYRPAEELAAWKARDPIPSFRAHLERELGVAASELDELEVQELRRIDQAVEFAQSSPFPDAAEALDDLYAERNT